MIYNLNDIYPIRKVDGNMALSDNGDITFLYAMSLPEKYSLSESAFDQMHLDRFRFYSMLPANTVVHNQHFYLDSVFHGFPENETFLQKAFNNHFQGRNYMEHIAFCYITLSNLKTMKRGYLNSSFFTRNNAHIKEDLTKIQEFSKSVSRAVTFLNNSGTIHLEPLNEDEIKATVLHYITGFNGAKLTDVQFKPQFKIGDNHFKAYAIAHNDSLPHNIKNILPDRKLSTEEFPYFKGYTEPLGLELECNHILNQYVYLDSHKDHLKELDQKVDELNRVKFSRANKKGAEKMEEYANSIYDDDTAHLMRSHINLLVWDKDQKNLSNIDNNVLASMQEIDLLPYSPTLKDQAHYFLSAIPTNAAKLPAQETFNFDLKKSVCFDICESMYKSDEKGLVLNDRLTNLPIRKDVYYKPYKDKLIAARNFFIIAPTGGGKSVLLNKILRTFLEDDFTCIIIDMGGTTEVMASLYPEKFEVIKYEEGQPLGINPFLIDDLHQLDSDKIETLRDFLSILWLKDKPIEDEHKVSLGKIIKYYYEHFTGKYDFYTFFDYVKTNKKQIISDLEIEGFFPMDTFLHILSEYYHNGLYEFLFKDHEINPAIKNTRKQGIIFELQELKDNVTLLPVVLTMLRDTIENRIFKNHAGKKMLAFEEAAKTMKIPSVFTAIDYYYQTGRKYGCTTGLVLQYIGNIPDTEMGRAIIANTHIFYLLEHDKGFKTLKDKCEFTDHTIYQLRSVKNNLKSDRPNTEFVICFGRKQSNIYRLELPKEELLTYLSEKDEKEVIFREFEKTGNMEETITNIINNNLL